MSDKPETELQPWEVGAEAICDAMIARAPKAVRRLSEDLYEGLMNDVQDWLRDNVSYNLSSELARRDHEIAVLKDQRADLLAVVEALRLNRASIYTDEPFRGALLKLFDMADAAHAKATGAISALDLVAFPSTRVRPLIGSRARERPSGVGRPSCPLCAGLAVQAPVCLHKQEAGEGVKLHGRASPLNRCGALPRRPAGDKSPPPLTAWADTRSHGSKCQGRRGSGNTPP